jgi:hypothetical protein
VVGAVAAQITRARYRSRHRSTWWGGQCKAAHPGEVATGSFLEKALMSFRRIGNCRANSILIVHR